jgi:hypothetical protein
MRFLGQVTPETIPLGTVNPSPRQSKTEEERIPSCPRGQYLHQSAHTENPIEQGSSNENAMVTKRDDA